ncbi:very short patch repair endonuclease [Hydrogenimonas urashimensis]|uniref:very short patch repair endonuclease n=1 Tax=Hydrogenimonas urashimensis TaxID=2740515 RepID=UPI001915F09A|nr:very short patch repair endonuclease [Hydrogenimonas urashimensis]
MDTVDRATRSKIMSKVGREATGPEMKLRKALFARGFRYRLNVKKLPGSPDIVLPKYKAAIFVHGCFWHRHEGCKYATMPKSRVEFWTKKFEDNVARDRRNVEKLLEMGWRVLVVWECSLKGKDTGKVERTIEEVVRWLKSDVRFAEVPNDSIDDVSGLEEKLLDDS